jgi:phosphatidylglycerol:prolipoprotein diacylglycerol transferase
MLSTAHHFVHNINPVLWRIGGIKLYYYGLAYALGFLGLHFWLWLRRNRLGWRTREIYDFSIIFAICVLVFGRAFEIIVYEWDYYRMHLPQLLSYWRGGMASHGVLLGAIVGIFLFGRLRSKDFLCIADEVVIPAAFLLALGRIGNFINGQIYGSVTNVWWAVKFPDAEGFRHPVALYESLKNFAIIPILLSVRSKCIPGRGKPLAHFIFWYGFLRIFADYFREYGTEILGIGTGQYFNFFMALGGIGLYVWCRRIERLQGAGELKTGELDCEKARSHSYTSPAGSTFRLFAKKAVLVAILCFSLTIPSGWTQGVLKQYRNGQIGQQPAIAGGGQNWGAFLPV